MDRTHAHVSRSSQWDKRNAFLHTHIRIPVRDEPLQLVQPAFYRCKAKVLPQPECSHAQDRVQHVPCAVRTKCCDELPVDMLYQPPELLFADVRIQNLGVQIAEGRRKIANLHPVSFDPYYAC